MEMKFHNQIGLNNLKRNNMTTERIKEIQKTTAYPDSTSVQQALLQVWNECEQERSYSEEEVYHILVEHTAFLFQGNKSTLSEWFEQFKKK